MFTVHTRTKICSYFIYLIFIVKKFMNLMYKFYQLSSSHARLIDASPVFSFSRSSSVLRRSVMLHL